MRALRDWLDAAGIESGPIFRPINKADVVGAQRLTDQSVALIVKAYAGRAGLEEKLFAGHSLRAGFLTSAAGKGASIFKMMDVSRHKSVDTLRGYVCDAELKEGGLNCCWLEEGQIGHVSRPFPKLHAVKHGGGG